MSIDMGHPAVPAISSSGETLADSFGCRHSVRYEWISAAYFSRNLMHAEAASALTMVATGFASLILYVVLSAGADRTGQALWCRDMRALLGDLLCLR
jgi:hypothetical protein